MAAITRRHFLTSAAVGVAGVAWMPMFRRMPADATDACPAPRNFPNGIELYQQEYENWAKAIRVDDAWTCVPRDAGDVVAIANWARANGYQVRPRGMMHGWSPLTVASGTSCAAKIILVDTTRHLTAMEMRSGSPTAVRVQTGATLESLVEFLEARGFGLTATTAPGDVTIGGVLAIDGHGASLPANGEERRRGDTYGSLSNRVLAVTAVVWDNARSTYRLETFDRSHPHCKAFMTHLGRAFVTEATLLVAPNVNLRCVSHVDLPATDLFGSPRGTGTNSFRSFVDETGRAEAIWFPFTDKPWFKYWKVEKAKPAAARTTTAPYNYPFSDNVPDEVCLLADDVISGNGASTPTFGRAMYDVVDAGLTATQSADLWGASKNTLLYIRPSTLRVTANGYAVITRRANIQRVIHDFTERYVDRMSAHQAKSEYPMNMPVEIRATGLDDATDTGIDGAEAPALSALTPRIDHPEWDVAVWFDILTFPDTPGANAFYRDTEQWMFSHYTTDDSMVRPEWSKGWAYTDGSAWADHTMLTRTIPDTYRVGRPDDANWDWAVATLDTHDPHHVFSNPWLDTLLR